MSVKQIRWHAAVLAVTVIAVLAACFALATVTSNANDIDYDEETHTYTMTDCTYAELIYLEGGVTTTINISGENYLTYALESPYPVDCITGDGDLIITGDGTLEINNGGIHCYDFTLSNGAQLKLEDELDVMGDVTVDNADIEIENGVMYCGFDKQNHSFTDSQIKVTKTKQSPYTHDGMSLYGDTVFTDCNVTLENAALSSYPGDELTIDGGTFTFTQDETDLFPSLNVGYKAKINNAVIQANTNCHIQNLEMTDSSLDIMAPQTLNILNNNQPFGLYGDNLVISGSKINIGEKWLAGIYATQQLIMTGNTEANAEGVQFGIIGNDVQITHSSGTFKATDNDAAIAAVAAFKTQTGQNGTVTPGTITLTATDVKEPAGGTVDKANVKLSPDPSAPEITITAVLDGEAPAKDAVLEIGHSWEAGEVTKQPTTAEEGAQIYTCTICGETKTEAIPKLSIQLSQTPAQGEDGTAFGKGASAEAAEAALTTLPDDNDPAGTAFGPLQLKATKTTKNSIKLSWKAVPGATRYIIFANKCGAGYKYKKLGEVTGTSYTATQAAGAAIRKGTYYKFMMIAADSSGKVVSTSKTVHAATKGGKVGNHKKVTVKKSVTKKAKKLKKGKTLKLKAKAVPQARKLKVKKHRAIKYETSNPAVAKVSGKGTVKGVGKGTCYIYAYAQNGTCAKVKVTVK